MQLNIITPNKRELNFIIEDFEPISQNKKVTEIMLIMLDEDESKLLANIL